MKEQRHVSIISAVYPPEPVVSARMARDLADYLVGTGVRVSVICPQPSRPIGADYGELVKEGRPTTAMENGVEVVRLPSFTAPQARMATRLYESWSFGWHACRHLARVGNTPDLLYVNSWPLFAQARIAAFARSRGIPVVLQIMDVYPESLLAKLPASLRWMAHRPLLALDRWIARQAQSVVVISEGVRGSYAESRQIPASSVFTVPTWQDESLFLAPSSRSEACGRYGVPERLFTFLYLGNIGPVAGVDFLVRAFHAAAIKDGQLVIVGDGSEKVACVKLAEQLGGKNIIFISDPDARNVPLLQSMADVCLLPLKRGVMDSSIPSKLPAYMFSAKPVLATVDAGCDTARVIGEAGCGWVGPPEDLEWLASRMGEVADMTADELTRPGVRGRTFALDRFSKTRGVKSLASLLVGCSPGS